MPVTQSLSKLSIVTRLLVTAGLLSLVTLSIGAWLLINNYRSSVLADADMRLQSVSDALIAYSESLRGESVTLTRLPADTRFETSFGGRYWQLDELDENGQLTALLRSRSLADESLNWPGPVSLSPSTPKTVDVTGPDGQDLRVMGRLFSLPDHPNMLAVFTAENLAPVEKQIASFSQQTLLGVLFLLIILISGLLLQIRLGFVPLRHMREELAQIRAGSKTGMTGEYPAELAELRDAMNGFIEHNSEVVQRARTQVGNLAHALKTPLSVLSGEAQGNEKVDPELVLRLTSSMSRQIDHYLKRASAAARAHTIGASCDLGKVIADLERSLSKLYPNIDIDVETKIRPSAPLCCKGEREDLEELIGNLLENACKWSKGLVRIRLQNHTDGRFLAIIEDNGPGLEKSQRERILQRGARLDENTPGSGLGLSIVSDVSQLYGGKLELEIGDRPPYTGLQARLYLPSAATNN